MDIGDLLTCVHGMIIARACCRKLCEVVNELPFKITWQRYSRYANHFVYVNTTFVVNMHDDSCVGCCLQWRQQVPVTPESVIMADWEYSESSRGFFTSTTASIIIPLWTRFLFPWPHDHLTPPHTNYWTPVPDIVVRNYLQWLGLAAILLPSWSVKDVMSPLQGLAHRSSFSSRYSTCIQGWFVTHELPFKARLAVL